MRVMYGVLQGLLLVSQCVSANDNSGKAIAFSITSFHYGYCCRQHNSKNLGFSFISRENNRKMSAEVGFYRNSRIENDAFSVYAKLNKRIKTTANGRVNFGISVGVASYLKSSKHDRVEIPIFTGFIDFTVSNKNTIRANVSPKVATLQLIREL